MTWFTFSLLSVFALATAELTQQYLLNRKKEIFNEQTSTFYTFLLQVLLTLPLILLTDVRDTFFSLISFEILPYFILMAIVSSTGMLLYFRSFKVENISISTIFVSLSLVVSTILGILFFNEGFYSTKIFGTLIVLIAIISLNFKNFQLEKNHYYGLIAGVLFGVTFTLDKLLVTNSHPLVYAFWAFLAIPIVIFIIYHKDVIACFEEAEVKDFIPIAISAASYFCYNILTFSAYAVGGEVGRVDTINNSQVFLIILFEYFILKHKGGILRKLATAALATVGIVILGLL